jgi:stearoyl-CoA desaturase (delta-9 desaturase)
VRHDSVSWDLQYSYQPGVSDVFFLPHPRIMQKPSYAEVINTEKTNWKAIIFLIGSPIAIAILLPIYLSNHGFVWTDLIPFFVLYVLGGMSTTAGYHRYYSHRTYDCHPWVRIFFLIFGGATVQNTLLDWASDHRYHHQFEDREGDPYNINRGFWYAHLLWMFKQYPENRPYANVPDLRKDPQVMWQYRNYAAIVALVSFGLPTVIGAFFGRPFAGFLWGGLIRMTFFHHCTFMVNSVAHYFGRKTHNLENAAVDNVGVALVTFGEGYHSFHHAYPTDHRIGHAWYHYDPGKWLIRGLVRVGLASRLRMNPHAPVRELVTPRQRSAI